MLPEIGPSPWKLLFTSTVFEIRSDCIVVSAAICIVSRDGVKMQLYVRAFRLSQKREAALTRFADDAAASSTPRWRGLRLFSHPKRRPLLGWQRTEQADGVAVFCTAYHSHLVTACLLLPLHLATVNCTISPLGVFPKSHDVASDHRIGACCFGAGQFFYASYAACCSL